MLAEEMLGIPSFYEISDWAATAEEFASVPLPFVEPASHIWLKPAPTGDTTVAG
jgi:hypothetical protein